MTEQENTINKIETWYKQYLSYQSEVSFNRNTDRFMANIKTIPFVFSLFESMKKKYQYGDDYYKQIVNNNFWPPIYKRFSEMQDEEYITFCIGFHEYLQKNCGFGRLYYKRTTWIRYSISGNEQLTPELFKKDFIRPIVDFIINSYTSEHFVYYLILKYRERVERFKKYLLSDNIHNSETAWQTNLSIFLFDNGIKFYKEVDLGNSKPDFFVEKEEDSTVSTHSNLSCNGKPFIIETKYTEKEDINKIKRACCQLDAYLREISGVGCIVIFTRKLYHNLDNFNKTSRYKVIQIYIGDLTPSKQ